jgi:cytochrome P450
LVDYFRTLLAERRSQEREDLMSLMLRAEVDGDRLSHEEVVSNCVLLLFAGHETTTNLLGNGLFHLLSHPDQTELLRCNPALVATAVEEFLRYDSPVPATSKIATERMEWYGRTIECGDMVLPFMSSANRDPRQFPEPDRLDVRRTPNRNVAFAYGIHFCLGAPLARLEGQVTFETLLRRLPGLALQSPEPHWKSMIFLRGLKSLGLTWNSGGAR